MSSNLTNISELYRKILRNLCNIKNIRIYNKVLQVIKNSVKQGNVLFLQDVPF